MGSRSRRTLRICLSVLLAAVLGGAGWMLSAGESDRGPSAGSDSRLRETVERMPQQTKAGRLFTVDAPSLKQGHSVPTPGAWATETSYVKSERASISAYSLPKGERRWRIPLAGDVCTATQDVTATGLTAVVFRNRVTKYRFDDRDCDRLLVFDIDSGKELWQTTLPKSTRDYSAPRVTIAKGVVAVAWSGGSAAYRITGGKALWSEEPARCSATGLRGGRNLIGTGSGCRPGRSTREVWQVDTRTGRPVWTYKVPRKYVFATVLSTDPVTVGVMAGDADDDHEDTYVTHVLSLDEHGALRATIPLDDRYLLNFWDARRHNYAVSGDTLYLPTLMERYSRHGDVSYDAGAVVALDLKTGKVRTRFAAEAHQEIVPLRMSGDRLLALQAGDGSGSTTVVKVLAIDPVTGRRTLMLEAEAADADVRSLMDVDDSYEFPVVFEHGRLFFGRAGITGPKRGLKPIGKPREPGTPGDRYIAVAFGTG
ncbi:outer membrane protein assembly factor BamB family protein [Streptomyces brasiliensis]|nr:PQQ-binding-like beta-propeller repeat protein [Streptomyces brasiliensis]